MKIWDIIKNNKDLPPYVYGFKKECYDRIKELEKELETMASYFAIKTPRVFNDYTDFQGFQGKKREVDGYLPIEMVEKMMQPCTPFPDIPDILDKPFTKDEIDALFYTSEDILKEAANKLMDEAKPAPDTISPEYRISKLEKRIAELERTVITLTDWIEEQETPPYSPNQKEDDVPADLIDLSGSDFTPNMDLSDNGVPYGDIIKEHE